MKLNAKQNGKQKKNALILYSGNTNKIRLDSMDPLG